MEKVHASLFSGFGAADLAATWMGWGNAFWCEIDDFPRTVLSYWFPKSKGYGNIKDTDFTPWQGKIDVLTGGFPCQPFSVAGQRKGADDDRYLWPEMLRAIREIRPSWIVGENVGGIISMVQPGSETTVETQASLFEEADKETILEQDSVVGTVCRDLEQEGYSVQPIVIPACAVGAPHRRDRIFFIAYRSDARIEGLQREGDDRIYRSETTPDTDSHDAGRSEYGKVRCKTGEGERTEGERKWFRCNAERTCTERSIADPDGIGCDNRSDHRQERSVYYNEERNTTEDQPEWAERKCRTGKNSSIVANTQCEGSGQIQQEIQSEQPDGDSIDSIGYERAAANSMCQQLENTLRTWGRISESANLYSKRDWRNFPTQSPVCRGNDGLPFDVVRLTVSLTAWCTGSIKGYGNAIVPQVMYEIFKAIEESEK